MGMIFSDARNLIEVRDGRSGGKAVTLGRLTTYFHPSDVRALRHLVGQDREASQWLNSYSWGIAADGFFVDVLKYDSVESIDFSDYQGATIIHDLSNPLPPQLEGAFDLAVDGGTLEHIFNFPVAIANLMRLVRVEGFVYSNGPCNNLMGHGFYQFSPELMYRIFSPQNGFETKFVRLAEAEYHAVEITPGHRVFEVADPNDVGMRVSLVNSRPVLMMTLAKRISQVEPFRKPVLQSDYVTRWEDKGQQERKGAVRRLKEVARPYVPARIWTWTRGMALRQSASFQNRRHFKRIW